MEILQQKVLEIQVVEQKDLVIPAVHLNPVGGYNNQSDGYDASQTQDGGGHYNLRHPQHEDQMNNYTEWLCGTQPQGQYNNNQWSNSQTPLPSNALQNTPPPPM